LLQDLRNPTPAKAVLTFTGRTNAAQRARITELVQATISIAPDSGTPIPIVINATSTTGGSMGKGTMTIGRDAKASTIVHESLHALQQHQQFGNAATDAFAAVRTAGEKPVSLASTGYSNGGTTYIDATDSGYTFRIYKNLPANYGKFPEVLTTAFDHISEKPAAKDTELLKMFAQIVKDGGK
jgi:hypothetical protein